MNRFGAQDSYDSGNLNYSHLFSTFFHLAPLIKYKNIVNSVDDDFLFSIQAIKDLTHFKFLKNKGFGDGDDKKPSSIFMDKFAKVVNRFDDKLAFLIFTFPHGFQVNETNYAYLEKLRDYYSFPIAVEFRSPYWYTDSCMKFLKKLDFDIVNCDEPAVENALPHTFLHNKNFILKFNGRNKETWNKSQLIVNNHYNFEKYDYDYSHEELTDIKQKLPNLDKDKNSFFLFSNKKNNNHINSASSFKKLLNQKTLI